MACGPDLTMLLVLGAGALGAFVITVSFLVGFICLFTSKRKLGIWLTLIPAVLFGLAYVWVQSQKG